MSIRRGRLFTLAGALLAPAVAFSGCGCTDYGGCFTLTLSVARSFVPEGGSIRIVGDEGVELGCGGEDVCVGEGRDITFYVNHVRPKQLHVEVFDAEGVLQDELDIRPSYTETIAGDACSSDCQNNAFVMIPELEPAP